MKTKKILNNEINSLKKILKSKLLNKNKPMKKWLTNNWKMSGKISGTGKTSCTWFLTGSLPFWLLLPWWKLSSVFMSNSPISLTHIKFSATHLMPVSFS